MISIITATWNAAATLPDNLACIASQKTGVEHLLIDGASTDGTLDLIKEYCPSPLTPDTSRHPALKRFISEPDKGIYDAMNKGIALATGEVIGILNADDFYADNNVLAKVARVFEDPTVEACYGDLLYVRQQGSHAGAFEVVRYWKSGVFAPRKFYWGWMPPHPTFFVRRSVYERFGTFNLALGTAADYEIMLRFLLKHGIKLAYIPEILVKMRVGGASNASVNSRLKANRNDRKAWEVNGLKPAPWTLAMKPLRKLPQWWLRP
jgi:glycosyltransferase